MASYGVETIDADIPVELVSTRSGEEAGRLRKLLASKMQIFDDENQTMVDAYAEKITLYDDELDELEADTSAIREFAQFKLFPAVRNLRDCVRTECPFLVARFPILATCELSLEESGPLEQLIDELREVERLAGKSTASFTVGNKDREGESPASPPLDGNPSDDETFIWITKGDLRKQMDVSPKTVQNGLKDGTIPAREITHRKVLVPTKWLANYPSPSEPKQA